MKFVSGSIAASYAPCDAHNAGLRLSGSGAAAGSADEPGLLLGKSTGSGGTACPLCAGYAGDTVGTLLSSRQPDGCYNSGAYRARQEPREGHGSEAGGKTSRRRQCLSSV